MLTKHQQELVNAIATAVVETLRQSEKQDKKSARTATTKTEYLLANYITFKRIIQEHYQEIDDLRTHGVPNRSPVLNEYVQKSCANRFVPKDETVDNAVHNVLASVQGTVRIVSTIDKAMDAIKYDPYYRILEMLYFEGRTQEDIAAEFKCTQPAISQNKNRLVKELAMRIFPNEYIEECMK